VAGVANPVHHLELWTDDLPGVEEAFDWLLGSLGWQTDRERDWPRGRVWVHPDGVYIVLEQSPDVNGPHDRHRAGLNHLALRAASPDHLDVLRAECPSRGWTELFAGKYPHAGGPTHTALFTENAQGLEVEIVAE